MAMSERRARRRRTTRVRVRVSTPPGLGLALGFRRVPERLARSFVSSGGFFPPKCAKSAYFACVYSRSAQSFVNSLPAPPFSLKQRDVTMLSQFVTVESQTTIARESTGDRVICYCVYVILVG